jgi:hypothetical protein
MRVIPILFAVALCAVLASGQEAQKIIPVKSWPATIYVSGKIITGATVAECVQAGYRLLPDRPATPAGKRIKSAEIVQDESDSTRAKWIIVYEDAPKPPAPEKLTNVVVSVDGFGKVRFDFTEKGIFRRITWLDAPSTNK